MLTRSASKILDIDIDFDKASREWNANKKKLSNGCYAYICGEKHRWGICQNILGKCNKHRKNIKT
jgi:hypothetical protein